MGGVDIHDQLRLQRYSLQLSVRFRKYYKTLFLGPVDMAMVNAFIVYREALKQREKIQLTMRNFWKFNRLSYCRRLPLTSTKRYIQRVWMTTCCMHYL
jgi:hypothetical protein